MTHQGVTSISWTSHVSILFFALDFLGIIDVLLLVFVFPLVDCSEYFSRTRPF